MHYRAIYKVWRGCLDDIANVRAAAIISCSNYLYSRALCQWDIVYCWLMVFQLTFLYLFFVLGCFGSFILDNSALTSSVGFLVSNGSFSPQEKTERLINYFITKWNVMMQHEIQSTLYRRVASGGAMPPPPDFFLAPHGIFLGGRSCCFWAEKTLKFAISPEKVFGFWRRTFFFWDHLLLVGKFVISARKIRRKPLPPWF